MASKGALKGASKPSALNLPLCEESRILPGICLTSSSFRSFGFLEWFSSPWSLLGENPVVVLPQLKVLQSAKLDAVLDGV